MAYNRSLATWRPARRIVNYRGVPIFRGLAWALSDAARHGVRFTILSADRRDSTITRFNRQFGTNLHSQAYLYNGWRRGLPGFLPANPPDRGTHLLRGDGVVGRLYQHLPWYKLGIDVTVAGYANDAGPLVAWLNKHGYHVYRPYSSGAEAHHIVFSRSPARHARWRLKNRSKP